LNDKLSLKRFDEHADAAFIYCLILLHAIHFNEFDSLDLT